LAQIASVTTIRICLAHESLDVTLAYLKGKVAEGAQTICLNTAFMPTE
jgi:hypothetical protein